MAPIIRRSNGSVRTATEKDWENQTTLDITVTDANLTVDY